MMWGVRSRSASPKWMSVLACCGVVAVLLGLAMSIGWSDGRDDLDRRLEEIQRQMEEAAEKGEPPSAELMAELQKLMDELQKEMADEEDGSGEPEDEADVWTDVSFTGQIRVVRKVSWAGKQGEADASLEDKAMMTAVVTGCEEEKSDEGEHVRYQAVGHVTGRCKATYTLDTEDGSIRTTFAGSDRHNYKFDPESGSVWCTLDVNPGKQLYKLGFPSLYISSGVGQSVITTPDRTVTEPGPTSCEVGGWTKDGYCVAKDRSYSPKSGFITGSESHTMYTGPGMPIPEGSGAMMQPGDGIYEIYVATGEPVCAVKYTVSWNLQIGKPPATVILEPEDGYEKWMPELPMGFGNTLKIKARIVEPEGINGTIEFELEDVSTEPGVCLNFPFADAKDDPDITIHESLSQDGMTVSDDGLTGKADTEQGEALVVVQAHDWGAFGKLSATAKLIIGGELVEVPAVFEKTGEPYVTIPKDMNSNSIADVWEEEHDVSGCAGDSDDDDKPEGKCKGDGLSAYEEYRGVHVQGFHKRLDPKKKDLFVFDPDNLLKTSPFGKATQLEVHYPVEGEMSCNPSARSRARVVNFNKDRYHIVDQHGLWVRKEFLGGSDPFNWGLCEGDDLGPPKTADKYVLVYTDQIREDIAKTYRDNLPEIRNQLGQKGIVPDAAWLEGQIKAGTGMVVTHESCHGLAVSHHYESLRQTLPKGTDIEQAIKQGDISPSCGQLSCVMRYIWDGSKHPRAPIKYYNELLDILSGRSRWANTLCETIDDCRHQIVVSDAE